MIPTIALPSSAKETTEEVLKVLDTKIRQVQSLYSHVSSQVISCGETSAMKQLAEDGCPSLSSSGTAGARDVVLDWRADPFLSLSDLTLNVYTDTSNNGHQDDDAITALSIDSALQQQQQQRPTPYYTHTLLLAYGGRKSNFVAEQIRNQRQRRTTTRQANSHSGNNYYSSSRNRGGNDGSGGLALTESIVGRAYDKIHRQNSYNSNSSSSFIEGSSNPNNNNNHHMVEYIVDIHIPSLAAHYMPLFLDYIYGSSLKFTTLNAPSLRHLSNRFDCRDLHRDVTTNFISCDLVLATSPRYIAMADELRDYELRDRAIRLLAERFHKIGDDHNNNDIEILNCLVPRLLRRVLQCDKLIGGSSEELSVLVARYLRLYNRRTTTKSTTTTTTSTNPTNDNNKGNTISSTQTLTSPSSIINNSTKTTATTSSSSLTDEDFYWLTHCQIMPRIAPTEAIYYYAHAARYFPRVMSEVGSGSLKSRCLTACSCFTTASSTSLSSSSEDSHSKRGDGSSSYVLDSLTSCIEQRGITDDPSSTMVMMDDKQQQQPSSLIEAYVNLDYRNKVQLLEMTLVGAKKELITRNKQYNRHNVIYKEVQQTEEIMYKKNMKDLSSTLPFTDDTTTTNNNNDGGGGSYDDTATTTTTTAIDIAISKAVVLGCGIPPANGLYLSSTTIKKGGDGNNNIAVMYNREGVWNGRRVIFVLYPVTLGHYYQQYKLGVRDGTTTTTTATTEEEDHNVAAMRKKIRVLYSSPKIVVGDVTMLNGGHYHHRSGGGGGGGDAHHQQVIIPEGAWEVEKVNGIIVPLSDEICPAPQFVGRCGVYSV